MTISHNELFLNFGKKLVELFKSGLNYFTGKILAKYS